MSVTKLTAHTPHLYKSLTHIGGLGGYGSITAIKPTPHLAPQITHPDLRSGWVWQHHSYRNHTPTSTPNHSPISEVWVVSQLQNSHTPSSATNHPTMSEVWVVSQLQNSHTPSSATNHSPISEVWVGRPASQLHV